MVKEDDWSELEDGAVVTEKVALSSKRQERAAAAAGNLCGQR